MASDDLKTALTGLSAAAPAEIEPALSYLDNLANSSRGYKLLCSKEVRRKISAFVAGCASKASASTTLLGLKLAVRIAEAGPAIARALAVEIGTKPLVTILRRPSSSADTWAQTCELLLLMLRASKKLALSMRLDGGIEALCHLLTGNPDHTVLRPACLTLSACCEDNENNIRIAQKKGTVKVCLSALRARGASAIVCSPLIRLLATLCYGARFRALLLSSDAEAYGLIVGVLKRHVDDVDVAISGLALLNSLASDAESAAQLCEAGAFPAAWSAVVRHIGTAAVGRQAMSTIWKLVAALSHKTTAETGDADGSGGTSTGPISGAFKTLTSVAGAYSSLSHGDVDKALAVGLPPSAAPTSSSLPVSLPPGTILTLGKVYSKPGLSNAGPPTTLTSWALPIKYLQWYPAQMSEINSLPKWAGAYLPRPGWHPYLPHKPVRFRIAYAVIRAKKAPTDMVEDTTAPTNTESDLSFFGVKSATFSSSLAENAASDLQSQLKHSINALMDDEGLFRPAKAASRSPECEPEASPSHQAKSVKIEPEEPIERIPSPVIPSPYKSYRSPLTSPSAALSNSNTASMVQLADAKTDTGTVSLNSGAMGRGISLAVRPPARSMSVLSVNAYETSEVAETQAALDYTLLKRKLIHAQSMSDMLSSSNSQLPLPVLSERAALRRFASKPDVRVQAELMRDETAGVLPRLRPSGDVGSPILMAQSAPYEQGVMEGAEDSMAVEKILREALEGDTILARDVMLPRTVNEEFSTTRSPSSSSTSRPSSPLTTADESVSKPPRVPRPASGSTFRTHSMPERPPTATRPKLRIAAEVAAARRASDFDGAPAEERSATGGKMRSPQKKPPIPASRPLRTMSDFGPTTSTTTNTSAGIATMSIPMSSPTAAGAAVTGEKGAVRKTAFDMSHAWLNAPHWFAELQLTAAFTWDMAPYRSLFWKAARAQLGSMDVRGAAAVVDPDDELNVLVSDYITETLSQLELTSPRSKTTSFPARKIVALHSMNPENALARKHMHFVSLALARAMCGTGPYAFDEKRLVERRLPSSVMDVEALPSSCRTGVQEVYKAQGVAVPSKVRVPRVFVGPSGVVSVRKFTIPAVSLPTAFHALPPVGKILGVPRAFAPESLRRLQAFPSTLFLPSSSLLVKGYALLSGVATDEAGREADLPEPLVVCTPEQRTALIGRSMLQTIARAGVAAGQLMRHRFLGGSADATGEMESATDEASALAPLLSDAQYVPVYHRFTDLPAEPTAPTVVGAICKLSGVGEAPPQTVTLVQYTYDPSEAAARPPRLPKAEVSVVVPFQTVDDDGGHRAGPNAFDRPDDLAPIYDTLTVAQAAQIAMPALDPSEDAFAEDDDEDSQGSDEDVEDGAGAAAEENESTEDAPETNTPNKHGITPDEDADSDTKLSVPPALQTALLRASRYHLQRVREHAAPVALSKKDVMRVLSEAADEVQGAILASHGGSVAALTSIAARVRRSVGLPPADPVAVGKRVCALSKIPSLEFDSKFETGNLCAANRVGPLEYELTLDADTNTSGHTQWFFFRVRKIVAEDGTMTFMTSQGRSEQREIIPKDLLFQADSKKSLDETMAYKFVDTSNEGVKPIYKFHIVNLEKGGSSFNDGMRPLVYYQFGDDSSMPPAPSTTDAASQIGTFMPPAASYQASYLPTLPGEGWRRSCCDVIYYRNQYSRLKVKATPPTTYDDADDIPASTTTGSTRANNATGAADMGPVPTVSPQYSETWSLSFPPGVHTVYFAYCYPYTYTDLRRDIVRWERRALRLGCVSESARTTRWGGVSEFEDLASKLSTEEYKTVKIREFDAKAALDPVDGLHAEAMDPATLKYAAFSGCWVPSSIPMAPRPGCSFDVNMPLGTFFMSDVMHRTVLCHTLSGNPVPLLTITDFTSGPAALAARPYIVLSGRVHPGETNGSWMLRGVIDFLTSSAPVAVELRRRVIFKIIPMLNPDGVINGHHRTNLAGLDLNRHWTNPDLHKAPTIWHLRNMIMTLQNRAAASSMFAEALASTPLAMEDLSFFDPYKFLPGLAGLQGAADADEKAPKPGNLQILPPVAQPVLLFVDFHGHSRRQDVFTFGCHELTMDCAPFVPGELPPEPPTNPAPNLFPRLLAARVDTFSYRACSWKVQRDKFNCARVAMWRDAGLSASYTIEATFGGSTLGSRRGVHMNTRQFEDVGHAFCLATFDWLDGPASERHASAFDTVKKIAELRAQAAAMTGGAALHGAGARRGSVTVDYGGGRVSTVSAGPERPKTAAMAKGKKTVKKARGSMPK